MLFILSTPIRILQYAITLWVMSASILVSASTTVIYAGPESGSGEDSRDQYTVELLKNALARFGDKYILSQGSRGMSGMRQLHAAADRVIDVGWSLTTDEREAFLIPIRIPIDKGLIGWRLFLITKEDEKRFEHIQQLSELKTLTVGQVHDWPDTEILRANDFNVRATQNYFGTFPMLKTKRIDYFPRSIIEIWGEQKEQGKFNLAVEKTLLLQYPAAIYYFVSKANPALAADIQSGLETMIKDGKFDEIFNKHHSKKIQQSLLNTRRIFHISNPYLPKSTPLNRPELWFQWPEK